MKCEKNWLKKPAYFCSVVDCRDLRLLYRAAIAAPGEQDRGAICETFCVVAQEYGDPQVCFYNVVNVQLYQNNYFNTFHKSKSQKSNKNTKNFCRFYDVLQRVY